MNLLSRDVFKKKKKWLLWYITKSWRYVLICCNKNSSLTLTFSDKTTPIKAKRKKKEEEYELKFKTKLLLLSNKKYYII